MKDTGWSLATKNNVPEFWDVVWDRPYFHYEKHHEFFWQKIRDLSRGKVLDIACGSASCWKGTNFNLWGVDFSSNAIEQAIKNYPNGQFLIDDVPTHFYDGMVFDTIVMCGFVNYIRDLTKVLEMVEKLVRLRGQIIITINVINDFPERVWTEDYIKSVFGKLGKISCEFFDKIGWFVVVSC